jgi:hypothetical protein
MFMRKIVLGIYVCAIFCITASTTFANKIDCRFVRNKTLQEELAREAVGFGEPYIKSGWSFDKNAISIIGLTAEGISEEDYQVSLVGYIFNEEEGSNGEYLATRQVSATLDVEHPISLEEAIRVLCESDEPYDKYFKIYGVSCGACFRPRLETDRCLESDEISEDCIRTMIEHELNVAYGTHDMELLELPNGRHALVYKREWVFPDWMPKPNWTNMRQSADTK